MRMNKKVKALIFIILIRKYNCRLFDFHIHFNVLEISFLFVHFWYCYSKS